MLRTAFLQLTACLLAMALRPAVVRAQGALPDLARVEVALWPEYDRREVLVIDRVTLNAGTVLPATISLPIPTRVGEPTAVAQVDDAGALVLADYVLVPEEAGWSRLDVRAESTRLQVEYYDALAVEGDQRAYTLEWPEGWPVGELAFEVQQPSSAAAMEIDPSPAEVIAGSDGLAYHLGSLGAQDGTAAARLAIRYVASAVGPALGTITPSPGAGDTSPRDAPGPAWVPWAVGGLGAASLAAGAVLYLRSRQGRTARFRPGHQARLRRVDRARADEAATVFCHSCGTRAGRGDLYCRQCGTRLRI